MKKNLLKACAVLCLISFMLLLCGCNEHEEEEDALDGVTIETEDSRNAKEILVDYLKENGISTYNSYYIKFIEDSYSDYYNYFIGYDENKDEIYFNLYIGDEIIDTPSSKDACQTLSIPLDFSSYYSHATYTYNDSPLLGIVEGNIDKRKFSKSNDTIDDIYINSSYSKADEIFEEMFKSSVGLMLSKVNEMLKDNGVDVSLADLGFTNYQ